MPHKQKPSPPPRSRAVDDEDPNYSPMDDIAARNKAANKPKARPDDMPGAEGLISARADEDTYD